ncbi:hypothetical protein ABIA06_005415 [Bradyrhizobium yuanmingense]|uniref:hypothetical protein n=1 Tax=Bradyrhizobium yuanmingense TaxID=108015 RepID=UPI003518A634
MNQWVIPLDNLKMRTERRWAGKNDLDLIVPLSRQAPPRCLRKRTGNSRYLIPGVSKADRETEIGMPARRLNDAPIELGCQGVR